MARLTALVFFRAVLAANYYGCYTEGSHSRALTGDATFNFTAMSVSYCQSYCIPKGFKLFGLEYTGECYCGDNLAVGATETFESQCNIKCPGNGDEKCGGSSRLSLWGVSAAPPSQTSAGKTGATAVRLGCYTEGNGTRALTGASTSDFSATGMTNEDCGNFCDHQGFAIFGTEYSGECYCGNALDKSSKVAPAAQCNMACAGKKNETCGGPDRLSVSQWQ